MRFKKVKYTEKLLEKDYIDKLLRMSPRERQKEPIIFNPRIKKRNKDIVKKPRLKWTKDRLAEWLKKKEIKTIKQFFDRRWKGEPVLITFQRFFGSWREALKYTWGTDFPSYNHPLKRKPEALLEGISLLDTSDVAEYLLKLMIETGIDNVRDYQKARDLKPGIFPSVKTIVKYWGSFSKLCAVAIRQSVEKTLEKYLELRKKFGRYPTYEECIEERFQKILDLIDVHGSKKNLDSFCDKLLTW